MQEFNGFVSTKEGIQEALRRNKRIGKKPMNSPMQIQSKGDKEAFLEWYVFNRLGTSPVPFVQNLETIFYAEQNLRDRRQRNIDFIRGRHFGEIVWDSEIQQYTTQWNYLRRRNMPPLTYNVVSKLVRSFVGQFREINTGNVVKCDSRDERGSELATYITVCMERIKSLNKAKDKDAMNMKEMLASGSPVFKVRWGNKDNIGKPDVRFRIVNRANFVVNPGITDYDLDNLYLATEIHDTSLNDIIASFANGNFDKGMEIRRAYLNHEGDKRKMSAFSSSSFDGSEMRNKTFNSAGSINSAYRYYESWVLISDYEAITEDPLDLTESATHHKWQDPEKIKKLVDLANEERLVNAEGVDPKDVLIRFRAEFVSRWFAIFATPWGMILDVRESPYKNGKMPFVFPPPDINGEVWGIVEEVLSAQLSLDRQIQQADAIVANASKGVWLIPDTAVPDTHTNKEYISELKKTDGAVIYKVRDGMDKYIPEQVFANSANVSGNVQQLIQLYSNLVDEISGNYGAAQGRGDAGGKTATGYALESQNAGLNIRDILENYLSVLVARDELIMKFILEGYDKEDYMRILGIELDPAELDNYEFTIEQSKGTNSPAHRLALEQELLQLVYNQLLPFDVFLDISNNPVMIQAKQKLAEYNKNMAMQQQAQQMQQASGGQANPIPVPDQLLSAQGHPQAGMLAEQAVKQQLPQLSRLPKVGM